MAAPPPAPCEWPRILLYVRFTPEGMSIAAEYRAEIARKVAHPAEHPMVAAHLAKYPSLHPSLALIFHLVAVADGKADGWVSGDAAGLARRWCDYLEAHARRFYALGLGQDQTPARLLSQRIQGGDLGVRF